MNLPKTIGYHRTNEIVVGHPSVGDKHAILAVDKEGNYTIEPIEKQHAVFVNNRKLKGKHVLHSMDIVCFQDYRFDWESYVSGRIVSVPPNVLEEDHGDLLDGRQTLEDDVEDPETAQPAGMFSKLSTPANRPQMFRMWQLVLGSSMLLTFLMPFLPWFRVFEMNIFISDRAPYSGAYFFLNLIEWDTNEFSTFELYHYYLMLTLLISAAVGAVMFVLLGAGVWKVHNYKLARWISLTLLLLFLLIGMNQVYLYLNMFSDKPEHYTGIADLHTINFGIGYWLTFICALLLFKSSRNGLWDQSFARRWVTLSLTFWVPVIVFLATMHPDLGVVERRMHDRTTTQAKEFITNKFIPERKTRIVENASFTIASILRFYKWQMEKRDMARTYPTETKETPLAKKRLAAHNRFSMSFFAFWFLMLLMLFNKRVHGVRAFVWTAFFALSVGLVSYFLFDLLSAYNSPHSPTTLHIGYGLYAGIFGAFAMLTEQVIFLIRKRVK